MFSSENLPDFHVRLLSLPLGVFKDLKSGWNIKQSHNPSSKTNFIYKINLMKCAKFCTYFICFIKCRIYLNFCRKLFAASFIHLRRLSIVNLLNSGVVIKPLVLGVLFSILLAFVLKIALACRLVISCTFSLISVTILVRATFAVEWVILDILFAIYVAFIDSSSSNQTGNFSYLVFNLCNFCVAISLRDEFTSVGYLFVNILDFFSRTCLSKL